MTGRMTTAARTAALLASMLILAGCGTVQRTYQNVTEKSHEVYRWYKSPGDDLIKKVGVVWVRNRTAYVVPGFEADYTARLAEAIRTESAGLLLVLPDSAQAPEFLRQLPRTPEGRIDNFDLTLAAQQAGFNAVVIASLIDVRDRRQEKGLWWFKDVYDYIDVTFNVEVYDSETAAKLLDERFTREVEADLPLDMPNQPNSDEMPAQVLEEIDPILKRIARRIADEVMVRPWVGFIRAVSGETVTLTTGADSGLQPGQVLDVFDASRAVQGKDDVYYFVPGLKAGEIEVSAVHPDRIEARTLSGSVIWAGNPVKLKD